MFFLKHLSKQELFRKNKDYSYFVPKMQGKIEKSHLKSEMAPFIFEL